MGKGPSVFYCAHCERKLQDSVKLQLRIIEALILFLSLSLSLFINYA